MITFQPRLAPSSSMTPRKNISFASSFEGCPQKTLRTDRGRSYITKWVMFRVGLLSRWDLWGWLVAGGTGRRELLVSKGWVQAVALTFLFGFFCWG
jgi:hypothetical protein